MTRRISELLDAEREMMRSKPLGGSPDPVLEREFWVRKAAIFDDVARQAASEGDRREEEEAVQSANHAKAEVTRLDQERSEAER